MIYNHALSKSYNLLLLLSIVYECLYSYNYLKEKINLIEV
jgi:hypothetical protein